MIKSRVLSRFNPGFLDTELVQVDNQGNFNPDLKKPGRTNMWWAENAAKVCVNAIHKRKREYTFSAFVKVMKEFGYYMPGLYQYILTRMGLEKIMNYED